MDESFLNTDLKATDVPRWKRPMGAVKLRTAPAPPSDFELLEDITASRPGESEIGTGVGVTGPVGPVEIVRPEKAEPGTKPKAKAKPDAETERPAQRTERPPKTKAEEKRLTVELSPELAEIGRRILEVDEKEKVGLLPAQGLFVPSNRRAFQSFIVQVYSQYKLPPLATSPDPDACKKTAEASKKEMKLFPYQEFVRDYIQRPSPYRGVLVYHGLGSGKTCSSIAGLEALYQAGQRPIYVLTPAALDPNYRGDIMKCGPFVFRTNNHWTWLPIPKIRPPTGEAVLALEVLNIPLYVVQKQKGVWLPDASKPANFDTLGAEQQASIIQQIHAHIESRITFLHYNGLTEQRVREWACKTPNMFDGATVIIDEFHNLGRTINNADLESFYKDEARNSPQYIPAYCDLGIKYNISYVVYRMLCSAVGCKIIALSATPIINFPQEVAILANVLAGDTRMVTVYANGITSGKTITDILNVHPEVDSVSVVPQPEVGKTKIRITPVPSGCRKVVDETTKQFRGFVKDMRYVGETSEVRRERDLAGWFGRIRDELAKAKIPLGEATFTSVPRLPDVGEKFYNMFVDKLNLTVKPEARDTLAERLSGLISFYKGDKAEYMAEVVKDEEVFVDMSDIQLQQYTEKRKPEIDRELKKKNPTAKEGAKKKVPGGVGFADVIQQQSATFKIFSRAACNFAFPTGMERPVPADFRDSWKLIGTHVPEMEATPEDVAEAEVVEKEETTTTYDMAIANAIAELKSRSAELFAKGALETLSPKFQAIVDRMVTSKGPILVYSNFKKLEGVGLFSVALEAQLGYQKLDIVKTGGGGWSLTPETLAAGKKDRYITYTGDEDKEKRDMLLAVFNGKWNKIPGALAGQIKEISGAEDNRQGAIAKVFMITQTGAEGISLSNVRQVHLMEPHWNYVRLDQVKGRAVRLCSHMDLPPEERTVEIFLYVSKFSATQLANKSVDETLLNFDEGKTTDETILALLKAKEKLADSVMDAMKYSAVDCSLNNEENGKIACYVVKKPNMETLFDPDVDVHLAKAGATVRTVMGK